MICDIKSSIMNEMLIIRIKASAVLCVKLRAMVACGGSSLELISHWTTTAPAISTNLLRINATCLVATIAPLSSEEVRWSSASELLVLVAFVNGAVVTDHDVEVAAIFWVPRLAFSINMSINVHDTDEKASSLIAIRAMSGADLTCLDSSPAIFAPHGIKLIILRDWNFSTSVARCYFSGLLI